MKTKTEKAQKLQDIEYITRVNNVLAERGKEYGEYHEVAENVSWLLKNVLVTKKKDTKQLLVSQQSVLTLSVNMIAVKTARLMNTPEHEDTRLDLNGYVKLLTDNISDKMLINQFLSSWCENIVQSVDLFTESKRHQALAYLQSVLKEHRDNLF